MNKLLVFPDIKTSPSLTPTHSCSCKNAIWEEGRILGTDEYDFSNLEFICETLPSGKMTDFAASDTGAPIISGQLKAVFEEMRLPFQYFPVKILEKNGAQPILNYYAINIVGLINSIDIDASEMEVEEEDGELVDIIEVETLVLKDIPVAEVYRLYLFERVIVVQGQLADKLLDLNVSGMKLIAPERWDGIASEKT